MPTQFNLNLKLNQQLKFDNFLLENTNNSMALSTLREFSLMEGACEKIILIWGAYASGLTHLLEAVCHNASEHGCPAYYIDMKLAINYNAQDVLERVETHPLVCLDNIELIAGMDSWERELFHLYNNLKDRGHKLLMASHTQPIALELTLNDLKSRLLGCVSFYIESLSDEKKQELLILKAKSKGIDMPVEVARFILQRASRQTHTLFTLLDELDEASLRQQRKLTVPFVKTVLKL